MSRWNWIGAGLALLALAAAFAAGGHPGLYLNLAGFAIVAAGTAGAALLSYPLGDLRAAWRVARNALTVEPPGGDAIVETLMDLSVRSRRDGILALEAAGDQSTVSFLKRALDLLVDGYRGAELREILYTEMEYFRLRRTHHERIFRHLARLAPAFGVAGSVVGLIGMLGGIGDPEVIVRMIPIALTSTLYGILAANFLFVPLAECIHAKTRRELLAQKLISDGVLAIASEHNTLRLQKKLESFLTPAERPRPVASLEELRERYRRLREQEEARTQGRQEAEAQG
ncbi:motility protein A [Inmirania thermothiophila]|uniref:Chemotaxis protein MotA n=1 Tax=Inmirania thermothiophila TaxID=1750597 RepID=A0A3N1XU49_9GAMM|nr:MotA/TolQ/ExbB proton channel family protein [Inmirania thermothiophila]ROR29788.1 chemotaxis protein MotA [Inmirania thermothiophila]